MNVLLQKNLHLLFQRIGFQSDDAEVQRQVNPHITETINKLNHPRAKGLFSTFKGRVLMIYHESARQSDRDWKLELLKYLKQGETSGISAKEQLIKYVGRRINFAIAHVLYEIESSSAFDCLDFEAKGWLKVCSIWKDILSSLVFSDWKNAPKSPSRYKIDPIFGLKLPFSRREFEFQLKEDSPLQIVSQKLVKLLQEGDNQQNFEAVYNEARTICDSRSLFGNNLSKISADAVLARFYVEDFVKVVRRRMKNVSFSEENFGKILEMMIEFNENEAQMFEYPLVYIAHQDSFETLIAVLNSLVEVRGHQIVGHLIEGTREKLKGEPTTKLDRPGRVIGTMMTACVLDLAQQNLHSPLPNAISQLMQTVYKPGDTPLLGPFEDDETSLLFVEAINKENVIAHLELILQSLIKLNISRDPKRYFEDHSRKIDEELRKFQENSMPSPRRTLSQLLNCAYLKVVITIYADSIVPDAKVASSLSVLQMTKAAERIEMVLKDLANGSFDVLRELVVERIRSKLATPQEATRFLLGHPKTKEWVRENQKFLQREGEVEEADRVPKMKSFERSVEIQSSVPFKREIGNLRCNLPLESHLLHLLSTELDTLKLEGIAIYHRTLKKLCSELHLIRYYLSHYVTEDLTRLPLKEYIKNVSLPDGEVSLFNIGVFGTVPIGCFYSLLNLVEERVFDEFEEELYPEEMKNPSEEVLLGDLSFVRKRCNGHIFPPMPDFLRLLKKFTVRCAPELTNFDEPVRDAMKDFESWCDDFELYHKSLHSTLPESLKVMHLRDIIKSLQELSLIHISEPTRQAEISYAVFCLKKKK
eukprot:TRINITY_DN1689_c0_g2_i4.p1 TRINITY_DN1689_c0_g2~~TRINITY_DN1689_c0_g2_i4.p1  ORF type:complete len:816 (-),score=165.47 TRINITY_DN1689_c0_g2_i4:9-2456(-)